jgi:hypothetical protein
MSAFGMLAVLAFSALSVWGVMLGIKGCMADSKPFMQGEGVRSRFDSRMRDVA